MSWFLIRCCHLAAFEKDAIAVKTPDNRLHYRALRIASLINPIEPEPNNQKARPRTKVSLESFNHILFLHKSYPDNQQLLQRQENNYRMRIQRQLSA